MVAVSKTARRTLVLLGLAAVALQAQPALAARSSAPAVDSAAIAAKAPARAETKIADFRYGAPRMGNTPRLPIPPPHRVRSGSDQGGAGPGAVARRVTRNT
jgi:hypothetical protein